MMKLPGEPVLFHLEGRHEVQPQQRKVRQVVPGKGFLVQVAMDKAQALEAGGGGPEPVKVGDLDLPVVADHDVADLPFLLTSIPICLLISRESSAMFLASSWVMTLVGW